MEKDKENRWLDMFRLHRSTISNDDHGIRLYWRYSSHKYEFNHQLEVYFSHISNDGEIYVYSCKSVYVSRGTPVGTRVDTLTFADEEDAYKKLLIKKEDNKKQNGK